MKQVLYALQGEDLNASAKTAAPISNAALETAILGMADRINYGIESTEKVPSPLCIWRWELKDDRRLWLPKSAHEKAADRLKDRQMVCNDILARLDHFSTYFLAGKGIVEHHL